MRTISFFLALVFIFFLTGPGALRGQEGAFAFQIQGGWNFPLGDFRAGDGTWYGKAGQGPNFSMGFTFPAPGPLGAYVGFGQRSFECDTAVCPEGHRWTSTSFDVALRGVVGKGRVRGWVQGGLHTNRMEGRILSAGGRGVRLTSDGGGGFEVGGGLLVRIGARTSLVPGVRYGWGEAPFPESAAMDLRYLMVDLGILMGF